MGYYKALLVALVLIMTPPQYMSSPLPLLGVKIYRARAPAKGVSGPPWDPVKGHRLQLLIKVSGHFASFELMGNSFLPQAKKN